MVETMKDVFKKIDKPLLFAVVLLCIIGLIMVFSASNISSLLQYKVTSYYFFKKQLIVMVAGFAFGIIFLLNFPTSKYHYLKSLMMIGIIGLLGGLFIYGTITNSARSWYNLGLFSLQPSEFAKTVIIIYLACYFGQNIDCDRRFFFLRPIIACAIVAGLIFLQPDLGTTAIISLAVYLIFMAVPFHKDDKDVRIFRIIGTCGVVAVAAFMMFGGKLLNSEQASRLNFRAPCTRPADKTGYQVCNGMIAINNGGLFGVGLGNSTQKYLYLPEAHTDFIFPIIVEELGSIAGTGIILLYAFILFRCLKIAKGARDLTGSLIAYGTFIVILLHLLVNFGGILALIPLTGVPVPLLSYGGSITLNTLIMIFLTLRVSYEGNKAKEKSVKNKRR